MGKSTYSFGEASPIKFEISDKMAKYYNEAVEQFFKAQVRFNQKFGRQWDPVADPIELRWTKKQRAAWNGFAKVFDRVVKETGPFHVNDISDDFLVKNSPHVASVALSRWGSVVATAAAGGVLYGFLRRP